MAQLLQALIHKTKTFFKLALLVNVRIGFLFSGWRYKQKFPQGSLRFLNDDEKFLNSGSLNEQDIALFVVWEPKSKLMYERYFDFLDKLGFKVVVVLNGGKASPEFMDMFRLRALATVTRNNDGRDFGAYKEMALYLNKQNIQPRRLLLCNDSIFADLIPSDTRFQDFVKENESKDFVGVAEYMGKPNYHVQSYFLILSNKVLNAPLYVSFWEKFFITDDRRLNIYNGEVGLTQAILKAGFVPTIFLSTDRVLSSISLENESARDFLFDSPANFHLSITSQSRLLKLNKLQVEFIKFEQSEAKFYENAAEKQAALIGTQKQKKMITEDFYATLAPMINIHGMITTAPFAIVRIFGFPFLKRDLVYRQVSEWMTIRNRSACFDPELLDEYINDQRLKKRHWHLKRGKEKWMYDTGMN